MKFEEYANSIRDQIMDARYRAFKGPSMAPHSDIFLEYLDYHSRMVGKMLRPLLCVAVNDALSGEITHAEAVHLGSSIELAHAGSLVHDDIIDDDLFRRGMQTVHEKFSVKGAILFGDMLYVASASSVRTLPEGHMSQSFQELMEGYGRVSSGAMKEGFRSPYDKQEYFDTIRLKTAALYRLAARLGCIAAGASDDTKDIMAEYAESIGMAFQLADDLMDIKKSLDELIPIGDMREGKTSLPIIYIRNKYPDLHHEGEIYSEGVKELSSIQGIISKLPEGIDYTTNVIEDYLFKSKELLKLVPIRPGFQEVLEDYGKYAIGSMLKEV